MPASWWWVIWPLQIEGQVGDDVVMAVVDQADVLPARAGLDRVWVAVSWVVLGIGVLVFATVDQYPELGPLPDAASYAQLAENLAGGDGYRVALDGEPEASRYPPGLPLILAPLTWVMDVQAASVVLGVALVVAVWAVARRIGGPVATIVAVLLLAWSPAIGEDATYVLADLPAALFTVLALGAVVAGRERLAGLLVGVSVWVRLAQVVAVMGLRRRAWPVVAVLLAGLAATKVLWGWGYQSGHAEWSVEAIYRTDALVSPIRDLPNVVAYPAMLLGLTGGLLPPGVLVLAVLGVGRRPERRFVAGVLLGALAIYVPYFYQDIRFLFPAAVLVMVYAGVWVSGLVSHGQAGEGPREVAAGDAAGVEHAPLVR